MMRMGFERQEEDLIPRLGKQENVRKLEGKMQQEQGTGRPGTVPSAWKTAERVYLGQGIIGHLSFLRGGKAHQ